MNVIKEVVNTYERTREFKYTQFTLRVRSRLVREFLGPHEMHLGTREVGIDLTLTPSTPRLIYIVEDVEPKC